MKIQKNISLKPFNTFGIDVLAASFAAVSNITELQDVLTNNTKQKKLFLGGGSNMLLTEDFNGLVIKIGFKGIRVIEEDDQWVYVEAQAGENWHAFVLWCLDHNYGGLENLSLIPGNVGTAPIQNIGAYGVELKDSFMSCEALNIESLETKTFKREDCKFEYRNSVFKNEVKGQYIITSVVFKLTKKDHQLHINYGAIRSALEVMKVSQPSIQDISKAVISIRQQKLPDPKMIGNSGSFFKNPIISTEQYQTLLQNFPEMPSYPVSEHEVKVPAGWLIEQAGFKGKRFGNYGVHKNQALVLVNYGGAKGSDILNLARLIQKTIKKLFDVNIEAEVNIL
ncbi:UDP-N-acetylmuramate dehydrogenase [Gaetbulibacter aestuarii]|uniref:UDP-N-acetylenolpyruvoylglucosamine reductase n=1 Tax=Gaetbulibacter aestuarii TaxID=1502358 RepID=A0ABW7MZ45_9FLAO